MDKTKFNIAKKGYDTAQVDGYIFEREKNYEEQLAQQKEKISQLKARFFGLESVVADCKDQENEIKKSIVAANEKANEMTLDLKLQYALEIERLKIFQAKWTNAYEELKERYHFSKDALNMESVVIQTALDLENMLRKDFSLDKRPSGSDAERQFKSEVKRLKSEDEELSRLFEKLVGEIKKVHTPKMDAVASDEFSMEKALSAQKPLDEICRSLGINGSGRA